MKKIRKVVTLLLAIMMVLSLAACNNGGGGGETPDPSQGGGIKDTFTYAIGGEPSSMDPSNAGDSVTAYVTNQAFFGLYHIGPDGSMVADAAKDLQISDDGLTYTFTLLDTKWSDGQPVVAGDYVYGVKHSLSLETADCGYQSYIYDYVVGAEQYAHNGTKAADMTDLGVEAPDDHTLIFHLIKPCPYFTSLLSIGIYYPVRADFAVDGDTTWANNPAVPTSGAYYFTDIDKADHISLKKNPYFVYADKVVTENLEAKIVEDMDAQLIQFKSGQIDFASAVDATVVTHDPEIADSIIVTGAINYYMNVNAYGGNEALANRDVRRALQLGIDRELLATALDAEGVYYPLSSFLPDGMPGINGDWNDEAGTLVYTDYEEAKKLLADAGYSTPDAEGYVLTLTYSYNASTMHSTIADVIASEYKKIGVKIVQETAELRTFFSNRSNGQFELARNAFSADYMDPTTFLELMLYRTATTHTQGDEVYDAMLDEASKMTGEERLQKLHDAEKYAIEEQCFNIPLLGYGTANLVKPTTTGYTTSPQANEFFWYVSCAE